VKRSYSLAAQAKEDLAGIAEYIGANNPTAAERVLQALRDTFSAISATPHMGRARDDLQQGLRVFPGSRPAHNYVVFYYVRNNGVEISDVIHGTRDWEGMFTRGDRGG
jgi:plasmid stabilization system protein ParE